LRHASNASARLAGLSKSTVARAIKGGGTCNRNDDDSYTEAGDGQYKESLDFIDESRFDYTITRSGGGIYSSSTDTFHGGGNARDSRESGGCTAWATNS